MTPVRNLPELENTEARVAEAKSLLSVAEENLEAHLEVVRAARRRIDDARQQIKEATAAETVAKKEYSDALLAGTPHKTAQERVADCKLKIETLQELVQVVTREADKLEKEAANKRLAVGNCQTAVERAELMHMIASYARALPPLIKLARQIKGRAHLHNININDSGYLLDTSRPRVGQYSIADDGSIYFQY